MDSDEKPGAEVLRLNREDQIALWRELLNPSPLTLAQRELGRRVRAMLMQMP